ncbi:MAG: hypothetical protein NXI29_05600 [bacterium]|nr:hypothetical protein [bacterium]
MGRKKKPVERKLSANIGFALKVEQKQRLEDAAHKAGAEDLSSWVREVLFREADKILGKEDH